MEQCNLGATNLTCSIIDELRAALSSESIDEARCRRLALQLTARISDPHRAAELVDRVQLVLDGVTLSRVVEQPPGFIAAMIDETAEMMAGAITLH